jgi:uncharacterized Tic20 family protein
MSRKLTSTNTEDRKWGMITHLSALMGIIFPLGLILGPLITWLLKRNESRFVDNQGKEALNFQITILIAAFVIVILAVAFRPLILLAFLVGICGLVFAIIAAIQANKGKRYHYPFAIRLIK